MKKLLTYLICFFAYFVCEAQTNPYPISSNLGGPTTKVTIPNYGALNGGIIPLTFADTSSANAALTYGKTYNGFLIYTQTPQATWWRLADSSKWVMILPQGGGTPVSGQAWINPGNSNLFTDASLNGGFGTLGPNGVYVKTNGITRLYLDRNGIAPETGTTLGIGIDIADSNRITYFSGGGGSGWSLTGNSGTTAGTNFVGTTDAQDLVFKRNSVEGLRLASGKTTVTGNLELSATSSSSTGVIYKGSDRFIHDFKLSGTSGDNLFVGKQAGNFTMTGSSGNLGSYNVGVGVATFSSNTTGQRGTAIGTYALQNNTTGFNNSALGQNALTTNTTGFGNNAFGVRALALNTTGYQNVAFGVDALFANTTGYYNAGFGLDALYLNTTGYQNTAIGDCTLVYNTTGFNNVAIGYRAGHDHLTGSYNTLVGDSTGQGITSGTNNTILGARVSGLSSTLANTVILSDGAGNQRLRFNNNGALSFDGGSSFGTSGYVLKTNGSGSAPTWTDPATLVPTPTWQQTLTAGSTLNISNNINSGNNTQSFSWPTLGGGNLGMYISSESSTAATGGEILLQVTTTHTPVATGITTYSADIQNSSIGTNLTNIALMAGATEGVINIAAWFNRGKVRFGTSGTESGILDIVGATSGTITFQPQSAAGTYNWNWPTTAGTSGYLLTSGGGGSTAMTWTNPASFGMAIGNTVTSATAGSIFFAGTGGTLQQKNSALFFDSTNIRLGIGTNTPSTLLQAIAGVGDFRFSKGASDVTPTISIINNSGMAAGLLAGTSGAAFCYDNSGKFYIISENTSAFTSNALGGGAVRMTVTGTGEVGINTTSPGEKLEVDGNAKVSGKFIGRNIIYRTLNASDADFTAAVGTAYVLPNNTASRTITLPTGQDADFIVFYTPQALSNDFNLSVSAKLPDNSSLAKITPSPSTIELRWDNANSVWRATVHQ
jgi:hypothetical protein